ncbi:MAG TPA: DUF4214 domain-containing protein, partial [Pirellulales bacterium]|nr:DUF4214 domain-containing protein [Pirellulales bacterium]
VILRAGASNNVIGGGFVGAGNVVSGNAQSGIALFDAGTSGNLVAGNFIGTGAAGAVSLPNVNGIDIASGATGNTVGGTSAGTANVISGNSLDGLLLESSGNLVEGNLIGTAADGSTSLGNGSHGVFLTAGAGGNTIGVSGAGAGNVIAFNGGNGILVGTDAAQGITSAAGVGNAILSNSIYANGLIGIDLGPDDGVTPNGSLGYPAENNAYQPFPVIDAVLQAGMGLEVRGSYSDPQEPNTAITLQFFATPTGDPSGHGQGQRVLGSATITPDGSGNASFDVTLPVSVALGQYVTATATAPASGTSEFSAWVVVPPTPHQEYVIAVYDDVLARAPDAGGLTYWSGLLDSGAAVGSVAAAIAQSDEYYANFVIRPAYLNLLGRAADAAGVKFWTAQMDGTTGNVTDQELEADLVSAGGQTGEFYTNAGGTNSAWIDAVYKLLLGRAPDVGGESYWNSRLDAGSTLNQVAQGIAGSQENDTQLINDDYFHYLGRAADAGGLTYWLSQFADGATNEDVITGFTGSAEYYEEHTS